MHKKGLKGFTLIELIVVIAIIAVLAGILIPLLMGYVTKASLRTANKNAKDIANYSTALMADYEKDEIFITSHTGNYTADETNQNSNFDETAFKAEIEKMAGLHSGSVWGIQIENNDVKSTYWAKEADSKYVGTWPNEASKKGEPTINNALSFAVQ